MINRPMSLLYAAAIILAPAIGATPAIAAPGKAAGGRDVQSFCRELVAGGELPWLSIGECVSLNISADTEKGGFVAHRCDNWRDTDELELAGFSSYADCIRNFTP